MWVVHWGLLLRLPWKTWVCPVRARGGGGAPAWVAGFWQVLRGVGSYSSLEGLWQPVLTNMLQYSCLENSHSLTEAWQATVYRVRKSQTLPKRPYVHRCKTFSTFGSSAPVRFEREGGTAAGLQGTLGAPSLQGHGLPLLQGLWPHQSLFSEHLVAGDQKASLASLSL